MQQVRLGVVLLGEGQSAIVNKHRSGTPGYVRANLLT
jgi:hypothetical protein